MEKLERFWRHQLSQIHEWPEGLRHGRITGVIYLRARRLVDFFRQVQADDCPGLAAEMAYNLVASLIPAMIFFVSLFGMLGRQAEFYTLVYQTIERLAPHYSVQMLQQVFETVRSGSSGSLTFFGFLVTFWAASQGAGVLIKGLCRIFGLESHPQPFWYSPVTGIVILLALVGMLFLVINLIILGNVLLEILAQNIHLKGHGVMLINGVRWIVVLLGLTAMSTFVYGHLLKPKVGRYSWDVAFPGAISFVVAWIVISRLFGFYVDHLSRINPVYGAMGAVVLLLTWLYLSSLVLFLGGEVTAVLFRLKWKDSSR